MSDADVTNTHYDQLWSEMHQLADAWRDRHDISARKAAGVFLQYGVTCAQGAGITLDKVLGLVRAQWALEKDR